MVDSELPHWAGGCEQEVDPPMGALVGGTGGQGGEK